MTSRSPSPSLYIFILRCWLNYSTKLQFPPPPPPPHHHSLSLSLSLSPLIAMESSDVSNNFHHFSNSSNSSPTSSSPISSPPAPAVIHSPCAACKILRRRCADKCVLAPYFPRTDPLKFTTAHRLFGASNIIKLLQDLPESQRADAVSSMVYEASARIRDPVYGCAGTICHLQKQVSELQAQLARTQAELINLQAQNKNLLALICMDDIEPDSSSQAPDPNCIFQNNDAANYYFLEDISPSYVFANSSRMCEPWLDI